MDGIDEEAADSNLTAAIALAKFMSYKLLGKVILVERANELLEIWRIFTPQKKISPPLSVYFLPTFENGSLLIPSEKSIRQNQYFKSYER